MIHTQVPFRPSLRDQHIDNMSVKFEKETVRTAPVPGLNAGKEDTMHKIAEMVTGGKSQTGYLAVWLY